jgi:formyl-CoA transferase
LKGTSADWIDRLNEAGVPSGPIYRMDEVFADPQVRHLGIAQSVHHPALGDIDVVGQAVHLDRTPSRLNATAPERGQHSDEILAELGYGADAIDTLRRAGII